MEKGSQDQHLPDQTVVDQVMTGLGVELDQAAKANFIEGVQNRIANGTDTSIDRQVMDAHAADLAGQADIKLAATNPSDSSPKQEPEDPKDETLLKIDNQPPDETKPELAEPPVEPPNENASERTVEERTVVDDALSPVEQKISEIKKAITENWGSDNSEQENELKGYIEYRDFLLSQDTMDSRGIIRDAKTGKFKKINNDNDEYQEPPVDNESLYKDTPLLGENGLVDKLADARQHNDRTAEEDIKEAIEDRVRAQKGLNADHANNILEKIDKLANQRLAELNGGDKATDNNGTFEGGQTPGINEQTNNLITEDDGNGDSKKDEPEKDNQPTAETDAAPDEPTPSDKDQDNESKSRGGEDSSDEKEPTSPEVEATQQSTFDEVVDRYAKAKVGAEKVLSRKSQGEELEAAGNALKETFDTLMESSGETMRFADENLDRAVEANKEYRQNVTERLEQLRKQKSDAGENYDGSLEKDIFDLNSELTLCDQMDENMQQELDSKTKQKEAYIASRVMELNKQISDAVIAERTKRYGKFAKFTEWMQRHKVSRMMVGAGLTGLGIVGMATGNAPLYISTNVLKRSLTGFGSYEMTRSIGSLKASRDLTRTELNTIDDYLKASKRETTTLRRANRASIIVGGALLSLGPTIFSMIEGHQATNIPRPKVSHHIPRAPAPRNLLSTTPSPVQIQPIDGNTLPWNFGMDTLHTNISDPNVLNGLVNNHFGISFNGNGLSNGLGAINSVTIPGQGTFTDLGHINGAIQYILSNGGSA